MADQTEQEQKRPWLLDAWDAYEMAVHGKTGNTYESQLAARITAAFQQIHDAARAADAEQIALLDSEISRLNTHVELVQNEADDLRAQIARLSAQVEQWEREHDARADETAKEAARADELEAERDAAQQEAEGQRGMRLSCEDAAQQEVERLKQQIATLAEALDAEIAVLEQEASDRMGAERDAEQAASPERANYSKGRRLATELCVSRLYDLKRAALQSTRPQEQP